MSIIRKTLLLDKHRYFEKHLLIINQMLPVQMTPKEAEVLAAFMSLEGDIAKDPFGTSGRKLVREQVKISQGGLGNYLDQLKSKGFIIEKNKGLKVLPILMPDRIEQLYQFKLELDVDSNQ
jgi:DNA-binding MarR family transcriptional regulator